MCWFKNSRYKSFALGLGAEGASGVATEASNEGWESQVKGDSSGRIGSGSLSFSEISGEPGRSCGDTGMEGGCRI